MLIFLAPNPNLSAAAQNDVLVRRLRMARRASRNAEILFRRALLWIYLCIIPLPASRHSAQGRDRNRDNQHRILNDPSPHMREKREHEKETNTVFTGEYYSFGVMAQNYEDCRTAL